MLPRELVSTVQPTAPARPAEGLADPRQQALQRALAPQLGKALHGEVLTRLTDGSFVVKVADIPTRMLLPPGARVGADVPLTLVSVQPRPTFQIGTGNPVFSEAGPPLPEGADPAKAPLLMREGATAASVARATALLQAAAGGAAALPGGAEARNTTLSRTGQAIGGVLAAAAKAESPQTAALGRAPVVGAPTGDAAGIAQGLQQAVGKSGLFYESHVAEWAQGGRALSDLNAEPQQQAAREGQRPQANDPATAQFINLQLATQEQAQVAWQGNLWPAQPMRLELGREVENEGQGDGGGTEERAWHSRLRLNFPGLGEVDARLTLHGGALQLRVSAGDDSAALLRRNQASLAGALDAAGTPLAAFEVRATGSQDAP
ncbi:flagellar hook-length control protein FliK [Massilia sp. G4R7]|uniref:Flagellar hook-length control protein FliK n=1 Tax=Massilia phyllostachyos TaxID=2898585 RepID=A0ABS8Q2E3_9BURK|nr:flagellar hook-length control protein FliK [Massilia phyllostachyos]MCD2515688.1 flagellar hook-length control protein FliK [Massilia phyllostachyos]